MALFGVSCYFYVAGHCKTFDQLALPNKHLLQQVACYLGTACFYYTCNGMYLTSSINFVAGSYELGK